jgi:hypothetical protein
VLFRSAASKAVPSGAPQSMTACEAGSQRCNRPTLVRSQYTAWSLGIAKGLHLSSQCKKLTGGSGMCNTSAGVYFPERPFCHKGAHGRHWHHS